MEPPENSAYLQAKLKVGPSDDEYEREADRTADRVMRIPERVMQRQPIEEEEEELQRKAAPEAHPPAVTPQTQERINSLRGGGQALPNAIRAFFEPRFGVDFSATRIHTGSNAAETAQALNARAFTLGRDIFLGQGEFQPETTSGRRLLAHELSHVIQQTSSGSGSQPLMTAAKNSTIMRISAERFQKRLGRTREQKTVVRHLFANPTFRLLWDWLGACDSSAGDHGPIKLRVRRTFSGGVQTFGEFKQQRGVLIINPMIGAARQNPQELVDTIVHELVHAISWALRSNKCPGMRPPLKNLDIISQNPEAKPLALTEEIKGTERELSQFERSGPSASDACHHFLDIRAEPQDKIVAIVDEIQQRTGIGGPTRTRVNQILREDIERTRQQFTSASEILENAPLLRQFRECRDEECAKPRRKQRVGRCFDELLSAESHRQGEQIRQRLPSPDATLQRQRIEAGTEKALNKAPKVPELRTTTSLRMEPRIQRSISMDWAGTTEKTVNPAIRVLKDSGRFVGITIPVLNGNLLNKAGDASAAVDPPEFDSRSTGSAGWECSVKSVGNNEASTKVRLPTAPPWEGKMPQSHLWRLGVPGCGALGLISKVEAHGLPSDVKFSTKVRDHEDQHVIDDLNGFEAVFKRWDERMTEFQKDGTVASGTSQQNCEATFDVIAGGSAEDVAERWFNLTEKKGHDFHKTPAGKPVEPVRGVSRDSCGEAEVWLRMP